MKDLVDYIVKNIVSQPEKVEIEEQKEDSIVRINLKVDPSDMGIVIGRNGQTIQAIRKILAVRAMAENIKVYLNLIDQEIPGEESQPKADRPVDEKVTSPSAEAIEDKEKKEK